MLLDSNSKNCRRDQMARCFLFEIDSYNGTRLREMITIKRQHMCASFEVVETTLIL